MLEHALDVAGTAYGAAHPDVLETTRLLAALHREAGELAAARRTLEQAIAAGQLSQPEDDPLMLLLTFDLGEVADEFGNRHEARRNMAQVSRLGPAALGPDHPAVRAAERYLAGPGQTVQPAPVPPTAPRPPGVVPPAKPPPPGHRPAHKPAHKPARRSRTPLLIALVVAAVTIGAALTLARLNQPAGPPTARPSATSQATPSPSPPARPAPTGVRLRDEGTSLTLTWQDPSRGQVPFIVAGGRAGEQSRPFAQLPVGRTSYTVNGLNPRLQYCFTIIAVYATDQLVPSELVCTRRASNPQPTRS